MVYASGRPVREELDFDALTTPISNLLETGKNDHSDMFIFKQKWARFVVISL